MGEFEQNSEPPVVTTERVAVFLRRPQNVMEPDAHLELKPDLDMTSPEVQESVQDMKMVIFNGGKELVGEIIPSNVTTEIDINKILLRLQTKLSNTFNIDQDEERYYEDGKGASYIRVSHDTYVEVRCIADQHPYPVAIGLRTLTAEELAERLEEQVKETTSNVVWSSNSGTENYMTIFALVAESMLPEDYDNEQSRSRIHSINLNGNDKDSHDDYVNRIKTLMHRSHVDGLTVELSPEEKLLITQKRFEQLDESLGEVGGHEDVKDRLRAIAAALIDPISAATYNVNAPHFYLYGPPGTGKTTLINKFAEGLGAELVVIKAATEVDAMHYSEPSTNFTNLVSNVMDNISEKPAIIFIDEIDILIGHSVDTHGHYKNIIKTMNLQLDYLTKNYPNKIILVGATNALPSDLDDSVTRSGRMEAISVPAPLQDERYDLWGAILAKSLTGNELDTEIYSLFDINLTELAAFGGDMTGADIRKVLENARAEKYVHFLKTNEHEPVGQADILRHIEKFKKQ